MAELLVVIGGAASFAQLIGYIGQISGAVIRLHEAVNDAPAQIFRIQQKLHTLRTGLEASQQHFPSIDDTMILPADLQKLLVECMRQIHRDICDLDKACQNRESGIRISFRERFKWTVIERRKIDSILGHLRSAEENLDRVIQLINLRCSLLACSLARRSLETMDQLHSMMLEIQETATRNSITSPSESHFQRNSSSLFPAMRRRFAVIKTDSWLRRLGFYGSFSLASKEGACKRARIVIGYKLPAWMSTISIDLTAEFASLSSQELGLRILPGEISVQRRVERKSPFFSACVSGDVHLIEQHLREKTGNVRDRTICTGMTPLMAAIEGKNLMAIECLLKHGADPGMGNDDQILPLFALLGRFDRQRKQFSRLPPVWTAWLPAFKMLVEHGASVHEEVYNQTISTFNIIQYGPGVRSELADIETNVWEFLNILHKEYYSEFDRTDNGIWSALLSAIRSKKHSVKSLQRLAGAGVNFARISERGTTALDMAAEMSFDVSTLEYLCSTSAIMHINRQDAYGWTPLHYAVGAGYYGYHESAFDKVKCLLQHGANPDTRAREHPILFPEFSPPESFTALELSGLYGASFHEQFKEELFRVRETVMEPVDEVFFEAVEQQVV